MRPHQRSSWRRLPVESTRIRLQRPRRGNRIRAAYAARPAARRARCVRTLHRGRHANEWSKLRVRIDRGQESNGGRYHTRADDHDEKRTNSPHLIDTCPRGAPSMRRGAGCAVVLRGRAGSGVPSVQSGENSVTLPIDEQSRFNHAQVESVHSRQSPRFSCCCVHQYVLPSAISSSSSPTSAPKELPQRRQRAAPAHGPTPPRA